MRTGSGNMGSVTDRGSVARHYADGDSRIAGGRVLFQSGSGTATLSLMVDDARGSTFDRTLVEVEAGNGADFELELSALNSPNWRLRNGDAAVWVWTDPGTSTWLEEVSLVPL